MKRALVIEGGSMRAAYANGVLAAFEEAGYRDFDAVYGTSAGGAMAAWFTAGQARFAARTWEYARDPRIINYARFLMGRGPLLDHDGLFRIVYERERPLDVQAVERAPHPVHVSVVDVETGALEYPDIRKGPVLGWLRATGRMPFASGPPVLVHGRRYLDGGLKDPIPIARAIEDGATDIVCIMNRPRGLRTPEPAFASWLVGREFPHLADAVRRHHEDHNAAVRLAERPPPGVRVRIVRPSQATGLSRLTRDAARIRRGIEMGAADGRDLLARIS